MNNYFLFLKILCYCALMHIRNLVFILLGLALRVLIIKPPITDTETETDTETLL